MAKKVFERMQVIDLPDSIRIGGIDAKLEDAYPEPTGYGTKWMYRGANVGEIYDDLMSQNDEELNSYFRSVEGEHKDVLIIFDSRIFSDGDIYALGFVNGEPHFGGNISSEDLESDLNKLAAHLWAIAEMGDKRE